MANETIEREFKRTRRERDFAAQKVRRLTSALIEARRRFINARSAIETNQVVDKDVHGMMLRGIREIDEALK